MTDSLNHPLLVWLYHAWGVEARWSVTEPTRFCWWPSTYAQEVEVLTSSASSNSRVRARTTLVYEVQDRAVALQLISSINAGACGYAIHLDGDTLLIDTTHTVRDGDHLSRALFAQSAILQALVAFNIGPTLVDAVGGQTATSAHPTSGQRHDPDEMLTLLEPQWLRPEDALRTTFSRDDIDLLAARIATNLGTDIGDDSGQVWVYEEQRIASAEVQFEPPGHPLLAGGRPSLVVWGPARHPDVGETFSVVVATPLVLDDATRATALANQLNQTAAEAIDERTGLGAWWAREGQLCWSTYLPMVFAPALAPTGHPARAEQLAGLIDDLAAGRSLELAEQGRESGLVSTQPPAAWASLGSEPGWPLSVFPHRAVLRDAIEKQLHHDPRTPLEVALHDLGPIPDREVATVGVFNPVGPTLTTLGLIQTSSGAWLVAEWRRHPFSPAFRVHAVLDEPTSDALAHALQSVFAESRTTYWLPEFVSSSPNPEPHAAIRQALLAVAQSHESAESLQASAALYDGFSGDGWARMNAPQEQYDALTADLETCAPADAARLWWNSVTDTDHVEGHCAQFVSAWDGAIDFLNSLANPPTEDSQS